MPVKVPQNCPVNVEPSCVTRVPVSTPFQSPHVGLFSWHRLRWANTTITTQGCSVAHVCEPIILSFSCEVDKGVGDKTGEVSSLRQSIFRASPCSLSKAMLERVEEAVSTSGNDSEKTA